ncbi:MAG TPA: hypothetical protein VEZ70_12445 [Allosphingosinicella sp.]|nr:hypothetical protein [Allosphingosinicella sp.]
MGEQGAPWWEQRCGVALLALLAAMPLLWPDIPPLVDLPGHMGRYRVQMEIAHSPLLQQFYSFEWSLIGNLGVDLLVVPLSALFGLEPAVKLIVLAIPPMTVAGFLWVAREVHGRVPPTALFAVPLAYNFPFHFGFVNFALSMAFAFLAFALWLRLARLGRLKLRAMLFVPISLLIWVTHTFGWGSLGVMAFSAELVRQHDKGRGFIHSGLRSAVHCLALAPPVLLMLAWRGGHVGGQTGDWFNWEAKFAWFLMALRDRWMWFDIWSLVALLSLLAAALFIRRIGFSRNLAASAIFLLLVYLILPRIVFGSAYADMRLVPYLLAVAVIAIRFRDTAGPRFTRAVGLAALAFVLLRTGGTTWSYWLYDRDYDRQLQALHHVPEGARLVSFVGTSCIRPWKMSRLEHLPAIALVRNRAFSNDQWSMAGAQLLRTTYEPGYGYRRDPSQMVVERRCGGEPWRTVEESLRGFPRGAFDFAWVIDPPPYDPAAAVGLEPVWRSGTSVLYRVASRTQPPRAGRPPS